MMTKSELLFKRACDCIPGGVNSPVRAFASVGRTPPFIVRGQGSRIWDADGKEYIDYVCSWGPLVFGHAMPEVVEAVRRAALQGLSFGAATEAEVEMAELVCSLVPSAGMVRMVNSGTEAVMSAVRLARGYTGRRKIIKFAGCYHGHSDAVLVNAGSGLMTQSISSSSGIPDAVCADTLVADFNDEESVRRAFLQAPGEVAAVILELVPANMGVVLPQPGFLQAVRTLCTENGALMVADEVITGFRLSLSGAQGVYGITPDLTTFGKIIGGGLPVGAFGGKKEIMQQIAPSGSVYQAGTLSGNPLSMAAGLAQLHLLQNNPEIYRKLDDNASYLEAGLTDLIRSYGIPAVVNRSGSLFTLFFSSVPVTGYAAARKCDTRLFARFYSLMLDQGIYLAPSQFEAVFLSSAHTRQDIDRLLECADHALSLL
jgi:glutamate-1-semialdehyde 2,1-aminomutase